jgi:hypothetical protein
MYSSIVQTVLDQGKGGKVNAGLSSSQIESSNASLSPKRSSRRSGDSYSEAKHTPSSYTRSDNKSHSFNSSSLISQRAGLRDPDGVMSDDGSRSIDNTNGKSPNLKDNIAAMEEEFNSLKGQYKQLLGSASPSTESAQAQQLAKIISQLHAKGDQLRSIRSPNGDQ